MPFFLSFRRKSAGKRREASNGGWAATQPDILWLLFLVYPFFHFLAEPKSAGQRSRNQPVTSSLEGEKPHSTGHFRHFLPLSA
ncbi:MAG TPA: hypothetical protein VG267_16690 [Terracidiphilus sp.]|nr:hypothetical protein [Terracidiphilus sp.]